MQASFHFNQLPKSVRERFIAATKNQGSPTPLLSEQLTPGGMTAWAITAAVAAFFGIQWLWKQDIDNPYDNGYGVPGLLVITSVFLVAAWTVASAALRYVMKARLPFTPGVYLLGADLIEARTAKLRVVPLMSCRPQIVHHHYNGSYVRTEFKFTPPTGGAFAFSVRPRHAAEAVIDEIEKTLKLIAVVKQIGDAEVLNKIDLFAGMRDDAGNITPPGRSPDPVQPLAGDIPGFLKHPILVAAVLSALAGPGIWYLRQQAHDDAAFKATHSSHALRAYLDWGKRHRKDAQKRFFEISLDEARRMNTVTALRNFLHEQADAPEELKQQARAAIHQFFVDALAKFKEVASDDAETVAFVERLLAFEEEHDSPGLLVQFRSPPTEGLSGMDAMVKEMAGTEYDFAPLLPHFGEDTAGMREGEIVTGLSTGFSSVFTQDVLSLQNGGRIPADGTVAADRATIEVSYEVRPYLDEEGGPVIYTMTEPMDGILPPGADDDELPKGKRLYLGIEVNFEVQLRVPGHAEARKLVLLVQPPERFSVGGGYGDPSDSNVYSVMTSRAFDELQAKLSAAFFAAPPEAPADELPPGYEE
jgi:hypothetical protein